MNISNLTQTQIRNALAVFFCLKAENVFKEIHKKVVRWREAS